MKGLRFTVGLILVVFVTTIGFAQTKDPIYQPEGVNMPGSWKMSNATDWVISNDPEVMGNFRMNYRNLGGGQYISTINVRATGGDAVGGSYKMLFTSGPASSLYQNKWTNTSIVLNSTANLVLNTGSDNNVTVENGFYYTFVFDDMGYANSRASMMRTSGIPVKIDSVFGIPTLSVTAGESVPITVKLSAPKSIEEKIYIRYSIDDFATSQAVEVTGFAGTTTAVGNIPGQANGTTVNFYVLSTTVPAENWGNLADHFTLNLNNHNGNNYLISFGTIATLNYPEHNSFGISPRDTLKWSAIPDVNTYRVQVLTTNEDLDIAPYIDSVITGTQLVIPRGILNYNTSYLWKVKDTLSTAQWSFANRFTTRSTITFANTETGSVIINSGDSAKVEGKVYIEGITPNEGLAPQLMAWIGVSETNTDPKLWSSDKWQKATFARQALNDDIFEAYIGKGLELGSYFYAFRYVFADDDTIYGGYNGTSGGGFWNITTNGNGVLTVSQKPVLYSPENNHALVSVNPEFRWSSLGEGVTYDFQLSTPADPQFLAPAVSVTGLTSNTYTPDGKLAHAASYIWRVRRGGETPQPYSDVSSFKTIGTMDFYNLQFVSKDTMVVGSAITAYAQVFINGYTTGNEPADGLSAAIGINTEDTDPSTWEISNWFAAKINNGSLTENNDEFTLDFGDHLSVGTYYIAARFVYGDSTYYGGYSKTGGGKWDGENHVNKALHVVVASGNEIETSPMQLELFQNYPNPFNPSTQISFDLPQAEMITLSVFDVLGREVAVLANGTFSAGKHSVSFNKLSSMSSGMYLYQLKAGSQILQKTMMLLK